MKKLINYFFARNARVEPFLPEGIRLYCIGDIHGRNDLLLEIHEKIKQDVVGFSGRVVIVYVGDFIDRGMFSREVIEILKDNPFPDFDCIYLRGNHEQTLLDFLQEASVASSWLSYGGQATLVSYGVVVNKILTRREEFIEIQKSLRDKIPQSHLGFISKTRLSYEIGSYLFVHAGINPKYSLARQQPEDLMWIRDEFVRSNKNHEKIIVHGLTVTEEPELLPNRIGIDTGAYASGRLSCLVLQGEQQRIIQTNSR